MRANSLFIMGAAVTALVGGTVAYKAGALNGVIGKVAPSLRPNPPIVTVPPNAGVVPLTGKAHTMNIPFYVIKQTGTDPVLVQETATLNASGSVSVWRQARTALTAMSEFPRSQGGLANPFPAGTKVLGVHVDNDGIATVDLSPQFQDNFNGGAREEQVTLYAIVNTVGSVKGVQGVRFAVSGRTLDEFGGHIDLSSPLTPDLSLVEQAQ